MSTLPTPPGMATMRAWWGITCRILPTSKSPTAGCSTGPRRKEKGEREEEERERGKRRGRGKRRREKVGGKEGEGGGERERDSESPSTSSYLVKKETLFQKPDEEY